ncbi:mRNA-decapping enzyme-like protein [Rhynchospora pubera]|uniref:mRNA-decapping enzyme-like protein n=1 Tax=Rhynchospora pubera TaxID=906938 RepID=A0AAV8EEX9_9POAL|nr:mRNA-decapping enzyme-like protein [Rhynchospora pubera]
MPKTLAPSPPSPKLTMVRVDTFLSINSELDGPSSRVIQGSFVILKRNESPFLQFFIMNRRTSDKVVENVLDLCLFDLMPPHLVYQHKNKVLCAITFPEDEICKDAMGILNKELKYFEVGSTSNAIDFPLSLAEISDSSSKNRLLKLILKQGSREEDKLTVKQTGPRQPCDSTTCSSLPSSGFFNSVNQCFGSFNFEFGNIMRTSFSGGRTNNRSYGKAPRVEP